MVENSIPWILHLTNGSQAFFSQKVAEELKAHPELNDLEDSSQKDTSAPPTTSAGTPQPSSGPTRIKLINNSANHANGASSAAQSDDES